MERAIAYIRVSTGRQVDGNSLAAQRRRVDDHVASHSYELDRVFVGKGESAKTSQRPELQDMLAYARQRKGSIQVLIFPKVDRFARYTEDYFALKAAFRKLGIRVESADERFDDSASGRFLESMLAATAQFDNDMRTERSKVGMKEAVLQGRWVWVAPRGYRNIRYHGRSTIEPDPIVGPLIAEAFMRLARKRYDSVSVRSWLHAQGVQISRSQFYRMIHNKVYIGIIEAFHLTVRSIPPFVPLVPKTVFYGAQQALRPRNGPVVYNRENPDFDLRGTLRCVCGSYFTASWSAGRNKSYAYYRCKNCIASNIPRARAEQLFLVALNNKKKEFIVTPLLREKLIKAWEVSTADENAQQLRLRREIDRVENLQAVIARKNAEGITPDHVAQRQLQELDDELRELYSAMPQERAIVKDNPQPLADFAASFLPKLTSRWREGDTATRKQIQRFFFPDGATIFIGQSRTAKNGLLTGLAEPSLGALSHVAHQEHETPRKRGRRNTAWAKEFSEALAKIYEEFRG